MNKLRMPYIKFRCSPTFYCSYGCIGDVFRAESGG